MSTKICAITGAGGWVGGCVARHFRGHGWEVRGLTRDAGFTLGGAVPSLAGVHTLVHCAWDFAPLRWEEIEAVNVEGSRRLLVAAREAGVERLVFISTMSAFIGCCSLYGRAKLAAEAAAHAHGALVLRPGLVYGAGAGGMFGRLQTQVRSGRLVPLVGGGSRLCLVHEEDLCAFIRHFAEDDGPAPREAITAAHPQAWTFRAILEALAVCEGRKIAFVPLPWRLVWLALKMAEAVGLRLAFRSDSLVSLVNQNPEPDFSAAARCGLECRPFAASARG